MKRLSYAARCHNAHKAQENPHGTFVVCFLFLLIFFLSAKVANAQWSVMQKYDEFGKGNFYLFATSQKDAKRIILETINDNQFKIEANFNKESHILFNTAFVDPLNSEYVYIVHCIRGNQQGIPGYHVLCYYMENRYRYFYDITENDSRISLIHDPAILNVKPSKK